MSLDFLKRVIQRLRRQRPPRETPTEKLMRKIWKRFKKKYPDGPNWQREEFHCFAKEPLEIRMFPAFEAIEYNVSNGGWAQLLWNCFGSWRSLLAIGADGYQLIGLPEQVAALKKLHQLFEKHESDCREHIRLAVIEDDFSYFGTFMKRCHRDISKPWVMAFYDSEGTIEARRTAWLEQNTDHILALLRKP